MSYRYYIFRIQIPKFQILLDLQKMKRKILDFHNIQFCERSHILKTFLIQNDNPLILTMLDIKYRWIFFKEMPYFVRFSVSENTK